MRVVQISDTHLFADAAKELWGVNTYQSFLQVLNLMQRKAGPDLILLTGDLSQDGSQESYQLLLQALTALNIPCYWIPGNHDSVTVMQQSFYGKNIYPERLIRTQGWAFILLDSTIMGKDSGYLAVDELKFLEKSLQQITDPVIVVLHHHPLSVKSLLIDQYILENGELFCHCIQRFPQVQAVLFGHVHQAFATKIEHIQYLSCPSTCVQFLPGAVKLSFDEQKPGYRWLELSERKLVTGIDRL